MRPRILIIEDEEAVLLDIGLPLVDGWHILGRLEPGSDAVGRRHQRRR